MICVAVRSLGLLLLGKLLFHSRFRNFFLVMQLVICRCCSSDKDAVCTLFSTGTLEHIQPCFYNAMTCPFYINITLALCVAGFLLGSVLGAVVLPGVWVSLVYYCSHEAYASYVRKALHTDMQDIPKNYLSRPDDCFWVAEAEGDGRAQIMGTVAVVTKQRGERRYAEMFRMIISPSCRRMGLGSRLAQTVFDFCKERGVSKLVLETSSTQAAAIALYKKLGFSHFLSHAGSFCSPWIMRVARVTIFTMKKHLQS